MPQSQMGETVGNIAICDFNMPTGNRFALTRDDGRASVQEFH